MLMKSWSPIDRHQVSVSGLLDAVNYGMLRNRCYVVIAELPNNVRLGFITRPQIIAVLAPIASGVFQNILVRPLALTQRSQHAVNTVLFGGAYDGVYGHEVGIVQNINV